jgi:hypothetical protein
MQSFARFFVGLAVVFSTAACSTPADDSPKALGSSSSAYEKAQPGVDPNLDIRSVSVEYIPSLDLLVFEQTVRGKAGGTTPTAKGSLDGAPVLGYVFPTTLAPSDIGFSSGHGMVALAVTAHPDFDDTPLWDENSNGRYDDDGVVFHPHWVLLVPDERVPGGLAVEEFPAGSDVTLPPTSPKMPMYMDSPGFSVVKKDRTIRVLVPAQRVRHRTDFRYDGVAAFMQVAMQGDGPMLGVYQVFSTASGDLSRPYTTKVRAEP